MHSLERWSVGSQGLTPSSGVPPGESGIQYRPRRGAPRFVRLHRERNCSCVEKLALVNVRLRLVQSGKLARKVNGYKEGSCLEAVWKLSGTCRAVVIVWKLPEKPMEIQREACGKLPRSYPVITAHGTKYAVVAQAQLMPQPGQRFQPQLEEEECTRRRSSTPLCTQCQGLIAYECTRVT